MSVNSISGYSNPYSLADILTDKNQEEFTGTSSLSASASRTLASAQKAYGMSMQSPEGSAAIKRALSEITPDSDGRITFKMITEHKEQLEAEFTTLVKAGLLLAGADPDVEFKLVANTDGTMSVICNDAEQKQLIEDFFAENEELEEQFMYIQALGNMERAQQSATAQTHRMYNQATLAGLQSQALEVFFSDMMGSGVGYSSIMAEFGQE
ncbi:hypothetical protein LJC48_06835, partial [Desulfovibrio sp. OttesenSCG-928-C06]|nr:hypothetical protein [Desulfovibrio sp. OttesenSCG-928-C06]